MDSSSEKKAEKLAIFVGSWQVTGRDYTTSQEGSEISGEEVYEWLPGSPLLVNNWCRYVGEARRSGMGLIGIDFSHHAFSSQNIENVAYTRTYKIEPNPDNWVILGATERAFIEFNENGTQFIQKWECTSDGLNWTTMWQLEGTKVKSV